MKTLSDQLAEFAKASQKTIPAESIKVMKQAIADLKSSGIEGKSLKVGDKAPDFTLFNQFGESRSLSAILATGPLVLSFYRGGWWPYCNIELVALQNMLPEFAKFDAQVIAISPEMSSNAKVTHEKNALSFDLLYDTENQVAKSFGLIFSLTEQLQAIYDIFKIDLKTINGDVSLSLPVSASYVIKKDGSIVYSFVDADYTKRSNMEDIIKALASI